MSGNWEGSDRKDRLPKSWPGLCARVKERDRHRCTWRGDDDGDGLDRAGRRCWKRGTEVDHIVPGDDHRLRNLRTLCKGHHRAKSSREGNAAQAKPPATREPEPHPGKAP